MFLMVWFLFQDGTVLTEYFEDPITVYLGRLMHSFVPVHR